MATTTLQTELFKEPNSLILLDPRFREDDERGAQGLRRSTKMMKGGCEDDEGVRGLTKLSDCNTPLLNPLLNHVLV